MERAYEEVVQTAVEHRIPTLLFFNSQTCDPGPKESIEYLDWWAQRDRLVKGFPNTDVLYYVDQEFSWRTPSRNQMHETLNDLQFKRFMTLLNGYIPTTSS
jgi:hypothetical protein